MRIIQRFTKATFLVLFAIVAITGCHHGGSPSNIATPSATEVTEFDSAIRDGDTEIVSHLLSAKPNMVNARDDAGKTPLTIANEKGDTDMANLLKKSGGHE